MFQKKNKTNYFFYLLQFSFLLFVMWLVILGIHNLSTKASVEGAANAQTAIENASILCYAIEGFYPPGLEYIKENYGIQIDENHYIIRYEIFASNIMPRVVVSIK